MCQWCSYVMPWRSSPSIYCVSVTTPTKHTARLPAWYVHNEKYHPWYTFFVDVMFHFSCDRFTHVFPKKWLLYPGHIYWCYPSHDITHEAWQKIISFRWTQFTSHRRGTRLVRMPMLCHVMQKKQIIFFLPCRPSHVTRCVQHEIHVLNLPEKPHSLTSSAWCQRVWSVQKPPRSVHGRSSTWGSVCSATMEQAASATNIIAGFKQTGIWSIDPSVITPTILKQGTLGREQETRKMSPLLFTPCH